MAYTKTVWQTGDTVTAEKLNNLENGVASANDVVVIYASTDDTGTLDMCYPYKDAEMETLFTLEELKATVGKPVVITLTNGNYYYPYAHRLMETSMFGVFCYGVIVYSSNTFTNVDVGLAVDYSPSD